MLQSLMGRITVCRVISFLHFPVIVGNLPPVASCWRHSVVQVSRCCSHIVRFVFCFRSQICQRALHVDDEECAVWSYGHDKHRVHTVNNEHVQRLTHKRTQAQHLGMQKVELYTPDDERLIWLRLWVQSQELMLMDGGDWRWERRRKRKILCFVFLQPESFHFIVHTNL